MIDPLRQLRAWQRFHVRITALYAAVVLLVLTLAALVVSQLAWEAAEDDLRRRMRITVQALADGIDPAWIERPDDTVRAELAGRFERAAGPDPTIRNLYVLRWDPDPSRLVFVLDWDRAPDALPPAAPGDVYDGSDVPVLLRGFREAAVEEEVFVDDWGPSLSAYAPVPAPDGGPLGLVGVDVRMSQLDALRQRIWLATGGAWGGAVLLVGLASWLVGRNVRDPLTRVIEGTARIAEGRFGTRLGLVRSDEFGLLSDHFDRMAEGLEEREVIRETFGRYVSPEVARKLLAEHRTELGGEERFVTVLFADLRDYSTLSERLPPKRLVEVLNQWLGEMQQELDATGGTVIEFQGDAILCVFGAPSPAEDHAERAVRAAVGMRRRLVSLGERLGEQGLQPLAMRIGVHTGLVVAGNIGTETRTKYTVIGDTVNVAARLEQLNKELGTDLLISGVTAERIPPDLVDLVDHGLTTVKGRKEPVRVLAVRG